MGERRRRRGVNIRALEVTAKEIYVLAFSGNLYPFDGSYMSLDFVRYGLFFINFNFNLFFLKRNNIVINLCQC